MKLALKHAAPSGFWSKAFHYLTKWRLLTKYPHAGIVHDGMLYHTTLAYGLHCVVFKPEGWDLFDLDGKDHDNGLYDTYEGTHYDWFSLLAFVLPWNVRDGASLYCYEWCWLAMTGENPNRRVTPEDLLALAATHRRKA
jgi:hypothetical protein